MPILHAPILEQAGFVKQLSNPPIAVEVVSSWGAVNVWISQGLNNVEYVGNGWKQVNEWS